MNPGPPQQSLWARLRAATRSLHAQAESVLDPLTRPVDPAGYTGLLTVLWGFQAPAERLLDGGRLPAAVWRAASSRLPALHGDLAALGIDSALLPQASGLPALTAPGAAWGALYVVEGMTLGGQVIRRRVLDGLGHAPVQFLSGHANRTQPAWRELGRLADSHVRAEQEIQQAELAAAAVFSAFTAWTSHVSPRPRPE